MLGRAKAVEKDIIGWRREFHRHPELLMDTFRTAGTVAKALAGFGLEVKFLVGNTGVVGLIRGDKAADPGKTLAIRADMDALPVVEETGLPFSSEVAGVMHACGHDAHMAMALGAAKILSELKGEFSGNVKFIFQPGEEGSGGARFMIAEGVLEDPKVDAIIGGHVGTLWPVKTGQVGLKPGPFMAASDTLKITVTGKGGHGAAPDQSVDPVVVSAQIALALQTIVSREVSPVIPVVVSIGVIRAGTAGNIIPDSCVMEGTVRYLDREMSSFIPGRVKEIARGIASSMRCEADVRYELGYPPLINDPGTTAFLKETAARLLGPQNAVELSMPIMGGEDMAYYLQQVPGTFFALGSSDPSLGPTYPNHHPKFDIDENALHVGAALFAQAALDFFNPNPVA